jgi:hypothetical protein
MSGTVNYPKVIDQLTDVIKELNVGFAPCGAAAPAAPSEEQRRADAVGLLKALLHVLEQGGAAGAGAAAAEHGASAQKWGAAFGSWILNVDFNKIIADMAKNSPLKAGEKVFNPESRMYGPPPCSLSLSNVSLSDTTAPQNEKKTKKKVGILAP